VKISASKLSGPALDWAVATCDGYTCYCPETEKILPPRKGYGWVALCDLNYQSDWAQGGPIIEREGIDIQQVFGGYEGSFAAPVGWKAMRHVAGGAINPKLFIAATPLIAAMRCFVASKLGDEVDVPDELMQ
jgi:hypothetical protein